MEHDWNARWMALHSRDPVADRRRGGRVRRGLAIGLLAAGAVWILGAGCARVGRLTHVPQTVAPVRADSLTGEAHEGGGKVRAAPAWHPLFGGDTLIGLKPGTGDSTRRYLGRLLDGYTADTLNIVL